MENYKLVSNTWSVYKNNGNELVLFPSIPKWLILPHGGSLYLEKINNRVLPAAEVDTDDFLKSLRDIGVLVIDGLHSNISFTKNNKCLTAVWLHLSDRCNLSCKQCFLGEKPVESKYTLTVSEIKSIISDISKYRGYHKIAIDLTGGEPLLNKSIIDIVDVCMTDNTFPRIITNGTLLDGHLSKKLAMKDVSVTVSLDGATVDSNDFLRGKGTFEKIIKNIKLAVSNGLRVFLSMTVFDGNQNEVIEYLKLAKDLGVQGVNFSFLTKVGNATVNQLHPANQYKVIINICHYVAEHTEYITLLDKSLIAVIFDIVKTPFKCVCCGSGVNVLAITETGDCYPCPTFQLNDFKLGNIREENLDNILHNKILDGFQKLSVTNKDSQCNTCDVRFFCGGGCRGNAFRNKNDIHASGLNCHELKKLYIEIIWLLFSYPQLQKLSKYKDTTDMKNFVACR